MTRRSRKKTGLKRDPHQARESKKYENPIPSREFIIEVMQEHGAPYWRRELAERLGLNSDEHQEALRRRLNAMERDGQLVRNRRGAFCLIISADLITGRVIGHPDGFGFLKPDEGGDDLFLTPRHMRELLHDDRAVVRVVGVDNRGRREGAVVEVLERAHKEVVGRLYMEGGIGFLVPDNKRISQDIVVSATELNGAEHEQMVVVEIVEQPTKRSQPVGRVVEILGEHMAPGMEIDVAIRAHELPVKWPDVVTQEISGLSEQVDEKAKKGRVDLRDLPLVTIDGADARDFDDAVYVQPTPKGWKLYVSIADVSSYVSPNSALDVEATQRGNSVYFPERVIPMLPEVLSNGLCSLNPHVDRLCMTCEMLINREGKIVRSKFYEAVMRSHARFTYDQVAAMVVEDDADLCQQFAELLPPLHDLYALYKALQAGRVESGAIDFDTTETRIVFDQNNKVDRIVPVYRNDAHRMIEECMLAANVAAARTLLRKKMPALYRNHEVPKSDKLTDLRAFLGEIGLSMPGGDKPKARDYADLLMSVKGRPDAHLIQTVLLRSMTQAVYSADNLGHFGLSFSAYTHFTSPIRRYPDLIVHRALKHLVNGGGAEDFEYTHQQLQGKGEHCSSTERRADEATREVLSWLKCEYMMDKVGEQFSGIITSVTSFGLFVELDEIYVDGLVHITALDNDYYHFDPVGHRLTGERSGQVFRLGDPMRIQLAAVNLDDRKIDFLMADSESSSDAPIAGKRKRRRKKKGNRDAAAGQSSALAFNEAESRDVEASKPKPKVKAKAKVKTKAKPKAAPKTKAKAKTKAKPKAAPRAKVKAKTKAKLKAAPRAKVKAKTRAKPKAVPKAKTKAKTRAKPKTAPKAKAKVKARRKPKG
ncbi:MAG: ribonuclease R [Gammaproteobacteria bacterium]|nr:ribonuclease R [Gammaproteobacteria bacterium]